VAPSLRALIAGRVRTFLVIAACVVVLAIIGVILRYVLTP
jgi:hypothetical protein